MLAKGALGYAAVCQPCIADLCGHGPPLYGESVPATRRVFMPTVCLHAIGGIALGCQLSDSPLRHAAVPCGLQPSAVLKPLVPVLSVPGASKSLDIVASLDLIDVRLHAKR